MRLRLIAVFALALVLRLALAALWYTGDFRNFETGDYVLYRVGADHLREVGDFSNSLFLARPPVYVLLVYALGNQTPFVLLADIFIGALIAPCTYLLARRFSLKPPFALLAALAVALDPASIVHSAFLGPEPLANLLLLLAVTVLLAAVRRTERGRAAALGIGAGALLALSALARPATYLLWLPLGVWLLLAHRNHWRAVLAFVLVTVIGLGVWMLHNGVVFGNYTVSTIGAYTMLYYRAASVEHLATGQDIDAVYVAINRRVEEKMGRDPANVDAGTRFGYLTASPELTAALNAVSWEIFSAHPLVYLATAPVSFARMYGLLPASLRLPGALQWLELAWNAALLAGALAGSWFAFRRKQWAIFWCLLIVAAYYTGGTMLVKSAGLDTRERSMLTPFMAAAWAYAASCLNYRELRTDR